MKMPRYLFLAVISFYVLIPALPAFSLAGPPPPAPPTSYQPPLTSEAQASPEAAAAPVSVTAETALSIPTKEVKVVTPVAVKEAPKGALYRVRTGIFSNKGSAVALADKLKAEGFSAVVVSQAGLYRVQVGAFKNPKGAEGLAAKLKARGYTTDIVVSD